MFSFGAIATGVPGRFGFLAQCLGCLCTGESVLGRSPPQGKVFTTATLCATRSGLQNSHGRVLGQVFLAYRVRSTGEAILSVWQAELFASILVEEHAP